MEKLKEIIFHPIQKLEEETNYKKIGILLGCIVGALFIGNFVAYLYSTLQATKIYSNHIDFSVLGNINYIKYIIDFLLNQAIFLGSIVVGVYVFCYLQKKEFKLEKVCQTIVVAFTLNYLLQAVLSLLFMFSFMDIPFLIAIKNAVISAVNYFSYFCMLLVCIKQFKIQIEDKSLWNFGFALAIIFIVRNILYLLF